MKRARTFGTMGGLALLLVARAGGSEALWDRWTRQLEAIEQLARAGQWDAAAPRISALESSMVNGSGGSMGYMRQYAEDLDLALIGQGFQAEAIGLGRLAAYRALCEAAQGRPQRARWFFYAAQNLDNRWSSADLTPYGPAGAALSPHRIRPAEDTHPDLDVLDTVVPEGARRHSFREPQRVTAVYPERPQDLAGRDRFSEALFVQITVEEDGTVTQPVLVDGFEFPGLMYRVFEAMSAWTFRPATLDGRAVTFRYVVPVVFRDDRPQQSAVFF